MPWKKLLLYMHVGHPGNTDLANVKGYLLEMVLPDGSTTAMLPAAESNNPDTAFSADRVNPYVDITNPDAVEWHFEELWGYCLNEIGVDGCKIDFCEELPEYYPLQYYDSTVPTKGSHHWYPTAYSVMYWEQVSSKPDGGMCYTRGGGIGSQRAPYMWAGDQTRRYSSLKWQLNAVMSSGLSGVPFMSYDMSGYQYGNDYDGINVRDPYFEGQVFIRGLQFTAFTPCMQTHGRVRNVFEFAAGDIKCTRLYKCKCNGETVYTTKKTCTVDGVTTTHEFAFWESTTTEGFDPKTGEPIGTDYIYEIKPGELTCVVDIYRAYVKLHELLTPYITELSAEACQTGMPLVRHLALTWQDDARVHNIEDEYTFGDAFLVAPVLDDTYSRDVYLPEGRWQDLNTGDVYEIANGVCIKNGEAVGSNAEKGYTIEGYEASIVTLPVFYNMDTESDTTAGLLAGLREILSELAVIEATVPEEFR